MAHETDLLDDLLADWLADSLLGSRLPNGPQEMLYVGSDIEEHLLTKTEPFCTVTSKMHGAWRSNVMVTTD